MSAVGTHFPCGSNSSCTRRGATVPAANAALSPPQSTALRTESSMEWSCLVFCRSKGCGAAQTARRVELDRCHVRAVRREALPLAA